MGSLAGRWVAKLVARTAFYGSSPGSTLDISQNTKWALLTTEWPTHSSPQNNIQKRVTLEQKTQNMAKVHLQR